MIEANLKKTINIDWVRKLNNLCNTRNDDNPINVGACLNLWSIYKHLNLIHIQCIDWRWWFEGRSLWFPFASLHRPTVACVSRVNYWPFFYIAYKWRRALTIIMLCGGRSNTKLMRSTSKFKLALAIDRGPYDVVREWNRHGMPDNRISGHKVSIKPYSMIVHRMMKLRIGRPQYQSFFTSQCLDRWRNVEIVSLKAQAFHFQDIKCEKTAVEVSKFYTKVQLSSLIANIF